MSAAEWARRANAGQRVEWRAFEVSAYQEYPGVARRLDPLDLYRHNHGPAMRLLRGFGSVFGVALFYVLTIVLYFPGIVGLTTLMGDRFMRSHPDPHVTIPIAGVAFAFSAGSLVFGLLAWRRRGRGVDRARETQAAAAVLLAIPSAVLIASGAENSDVAAWEWWFGCSLAAAAAGGIYWSALYRFRRSQKAAAQEASSGDPDPADPYPREPVKRVRLALQRLSAREREAVCEDISLGVEELRSRGLIPDAEVEQAKLAELGALALRMERWRKATDSPQPSGSSSPLV